MSTTPVAICVYDTPDGKVGGPIAWALDFIPFLAIHFEVTVLVLRPGGAIGSNIAQTFARKGVPCRCLDTSAVPDLHSQVEWIYEEARKLKVEIVVANLVLPALYASEGLRRAGIATIGVLHSHPDYDPFYRDIVDVFARSSATRGSNCFVAVSKQIADCVSATHGGNLRVETIPCGTRAALKTTDQRVNPPRMLYAGRLVQFQKRICETVESLLKASKEIGTSGTIIGTGEKRDWIVERLKDQDRVCFAGGVAPSEVDAVYVDHQIFVLLSDFEGLPIALVEAMARGLVPIGMKEAPGINEVIVDGVNGILVEDRVESFIAAVQALQDIKLRKRLSTAARETVERHYSHSVTFGQWRKLLEQLTPVAIVPDRIPRRCVIRNRDGRFPDYPPNRPGWWHRIWSSCQQYWGSLRRKVRPRSRIRTLFGGQNLLRRISGMDNADRSK